VPEDTVTLPKILSQYGYFSANFGAIPFPGNDNVTHSAFVADRTIGHRYLIHQDGSERLWHNKNNELDPSDYPDVVSQHQHLLLQRILDAKRPLRRTWPY
jgi:arylsulfatase A-like enzyme